MSYIGNPPAERFTSFDYQDLTGGTGTSFTLTHPVGNAQEILVMVNNVVQEPGVAYTVSGTALTMTGSIVAADDFYVVYRGKAIQTATHPSDRALTATDGTFNKVDIDNIRIDGNTISSTDTNGNVTIDPAGTGDTVMTGSGGQVTVDENGHITSKQSLDAATAGGRIIGASNRGTVSQIDLAQTTSSADGGYIRFMTCDSGSTNPTERMRLLSGGGLTFNGDTAAANALDDYEEGNFTVTVSSGISISSYDHQLGHYVKVGRQVTAWVFVEWNGSSRTGAHFIIDGLPFNSSDSTSDEATFGGFITYQNGFSNTVNIPHVPRGVNEIRFYEVDGSTLIGSELSGASGEVRVVVQYTVP